ncbi:MAG: UDP-N-acetylglucosamine 1-carboxyvinyltransferase [Eubacteriales bacterium]|nr:UDP-N-acetylglucosamine 1-carboxyvinyltransferase [Eubacteriales bacterium]
MEYLHINGGRELNGSVNVHGAKNSVLPILAATLLVDGVCEIKNCPHLSDVDVTIDILRHLGAVVAFDEDVITVDSTQITDCRIPEGMMKELRSSIIFLGALAARMGNACLYLPGGCDIGLRPIDLHLKGLQALGYATTTDGNNICAESVSPRGTEIVLPFPSVGATENIILASVLTPGTTTIINAAREPEIEDLARFLNSAGARIRGALTTVIQIDGVESLHSTAHTVIPDRILATTLMSAVAATGGDVFLNNVSPTQLMPTLPAFQEMGVTVFVGKSTVRTTGNGRLRRVKSIDTRPYPGFPTDAQAPVMAALTVARGTSVIKENIFENRFRHVSQLSLFGADITVKDRIAIVNGVRHLYGTEARCTDLRGGAAVVIAALIADGESVIRDIGHIDRGYENLEYRLSLLDADVKRICNEEK